MDKQVLQVQIYTLLVPLPPTKKKNKWPGDRLLLNQTIFFL